MREFLRDWQGSFGGEQVSVTSESFEEMALIRAIRLGEKSPLTSRKRIFRQLERAA